MDSTGRGVVIKRKRRNVDDDTHCLNAVRLSRYQSAQEAIEAATGNSKEQDELVRIRYGIDGPGRIAWPGDADYEEADPRVESGMVRWPTKIKE